MTTNELLREELNKIDVKISRLSNKVGFDVFKVLYGKRKLSVDELKKICEITGIDPTIFFKKNA